ncbi:MAG TPA: dihydrodipicolinate synthase family protein, partial [Spirochaetia bacterium]|nr:dihydrodipicolinate synthase family protein [Spirochaetia bacterium]
MSNRRGSFKGVYSLLLTPFREDRSIDWEAYERYLDWQLAQGPDGLFAVCGSSEMKWLTLEERLELSARAVKGAGDTPVVATANLGADLSGHSEELRRMADTGLAGVVLVPPPGLGENQERLGDYFAGVLDSSACPTLIYEWPMVSPYLIDASIYGMLVAQHGLAGIKDTTCTIEGITAKIERTGAATVFQANAPFMLDSILRGADGIMAIITTAAADLTIDFWRAALEQRRAGADRGPHRAEPSDLAASPSAARLHEQLVLLDCALGRGGSYPASAKY